MYPYRTTEERSRSVAVSASSCLDAGPEHTLNVTEWPGTSRLGSGGDYLLDHWTSCSTQLVQDSLVRFFSSSGYPHSSTAGLPGYVLDHPLDF